MEKAWTILEVHGLLAEKRGQIWKMSWISADLTGRSRNVRGSARNPRVERVNKLLDGEKDFGFIMDKKFEFGEHI